MSNPTTPRSTTIGDFQIGKAFDGNYGVIRTGTRLSTSQQIIIKELDISAANEADLMSRLKHPFIVELLDKFELDDRLFLMMQCAESGDLLSLITQAPTNMLQLADAKRIFAQMILGLEHMHSKNIIHGYG
jgi:NIMA (never in mitosis gene a)-related kinase 8